MASENSFPRHAVGPALPVGPDLFAAPSQALELESFEEKAHQAAATAETIVQTKARWAEWCSYALSSASIFTSVTCDSGSDGDDEPPQRHPLEVAATERFLAADLHRRVRMAQAEMPLPITIEEQLALPAWMSWGRGSAPHGAAATGGDEGPATGEAPALCTLHSVDSPSAAAHDAESPRRGLMSRAMHKIGKRLPNLAHGRRCKRECVVYWYSI
jgi:hypothetical protein